MYPRGQPGLPDDPVTTYINNQRTTGATSGTASSAATTQRIQTTR
jgi:hypothetical protein